MTFEARTEPTHRRRGPRLLDRALRSARLRASRLLLAATLWAGATAAWGQGAEAPRGAGGPEPAAHVHGHASGDGDRAGMGRHHLMLMVAQGVTDGGAGTSSAGLGYEYRLPFSGDLFGVGAMAELMLAPAVHQMLMVAVSAHPLRELSLQIAVGACHLHRDATEPGSSAHSSQAVLRASVGWAFHVGNLMLAPHANLDLARRPRLAVSAGLMGGLAF